MNTTKLALLPLLATAAIALSSSACAVLRPIPVVESEPVYVQGPTVVRDVVYERPAYRSSVVVVHDRYRDAVVEHPGHTVINDRAPESCPVVVHNTSNSSHSSSHNSSHNPPSAHGKTTTTTSTTVVSHSKSR